MKKYLLSGLACFLASLFFAQAQEEERFYPEQTRGEQAKIVTLLVDAESDLDNVPSYLQSQLYAGAEVILLRALGRLKQAQAALDSHPEMIQRTYPWIGWPKRIREELTESYREIRNEFLEIEKQAAAVMKDFERLNPNSELGYRTELIGYFESLLNGIEDPVLKAEFEAILEKIRQAIENDDIASLEGAFDEALSFIKQNSSEIEQPDIAEIPSLPASMENWGDYLEGLKDRIQGIKDSHPDLYGALWAKYNLLVQAVGREDEPTARRLAEEIEGQLQSVGAGSDDDIPGDDQSMGGDEETLPMNLPARIPSTQETPQTKPFIDFYNEARDELEELSPENRQKVVGLLQNLRDAIANGDWERARSIMQQIKTIFEEEGEDLPEIPEIANDPEDNSNGLRPQEDSRGTYVIDPQTGQKIYFPDLTRPGVAREYIGGEGARLVQEEKQFLEKTGTDTYTLRKGESREWNFRIQEDPSAIEFTDETMISKLLLTEQNGQSGFTVEGWTITNVDTGETIASASSGDSIPVEFKSDGKYRVEVLGSTDWDSPFKIEAILNISI